jgi:hypothetical protein
MTQVRDAANPNIGLAFLVNVVTITGFGWWDENRQPGLRSSMMAELVPKAQPSSVNSPRRHFWSTYGWYHISRQILSSTFVRDEGSNKFVSSSAGNECSEWSSVDMVSLKNAFHD